MRVVAFLSILALLAACAPPPERYTTVSIEGDKQPEFIFSGSGSLANFSIVDSTVNDPKFPDSRIWKVVPTGGYYAGRPVEELKSLKYGVVPQGYGQVIPADGSPPPELVEGREYEYIPDTMSAGYRPGRFQIKDGKAILVQD